MISYLSKAITSGIYRKASSIIILHASTFENCLQVIYMQNLVTRTRP